MTAHSESSYDWAPYPGLPFIESHPERLAVVARLYGLAAASPAGCRLLELGCATGGNLLPMALTLPASSFVGIDLSANQIATARQDVEELALSNVRLETRDLIEIDESFGVFDYIICHGVFSWVAPCVQEKILEICGHNLAADGLAFISYNTYPGWHLRGIARDILLCHLEAGTDPGTHLTSSREFLELLAGFPGCASHVYGDLLRAEADRIARCDPDVAFHEYLERENHPVYFRDFARRAESHGLIHVSDVEIDSVDCQRLPPELHRALAGIARNRADFEQRADFARGRAFRRSILCRAASSPRYDPAGSALRDMLIASPVRLAEADCQQAPQGDASFRAPGGALMTTNDPPLKAVLLHLARAWPRPTPFAVLCDAARPAWPRGERALQSADDALEAHLAEALLRCFTMGYVELYLCPPEFTTEAGERPLASLYPSMQARRGRQRVTNLLHRTVELDQLQRLILTLLDGTRDRDAILDALIRATVQGQLSVRQVGTAVTDPVRLGELLTSTVEPTLQRLAASALLIR